MTRWFALLTALAISTPLAAQTDIEWKIRREAKENSQIQRVMTIPGVGRKTAETLVASIDDPHRFQNARQARKHLQPIVEGYGLQRRNRPGETEKIATLSLLYQENDQLAVNELMEEFSMKVKKLNAEVKAVDIKDA